MPDVADEEQELEQDENEILQVPAPVANALTQFAAVSRRLSIWEAAGLTIASAILLFTLIALADRWLMISDWLRKFSAILAYSFTFSVAGVLIYHALRRRSASDIAMALEARVPDNALQERVSTTVEMAEQRMGSTGVPADEFDKQGISEALIERVADEAAQIIESLDIEELPDRTRVNRAGKLCGALAVIALFLCVVPSLHMPALYARALFPWKNLGRPSNTLIEVLPGDARVVEGATLDIEARLDGQIDTSAIVETREEGARGDWVALPMDSDAENPKRFSLKVGPMRAPLAYRVRSGDGVTAEYKVDVMPRPEIAGLKMTVTYPTYTKLPPAVFERINGDLSVLKGSRVEISVQANTGLSAAVLEFSDDRKLSMALTPGGSADKKGDIAAASFEVNEDTQYRVQLRSTEGVGNPDAPLFSLRAIADRAPQVSVIKPLSDEATDPASLVNLESRAEDDLGITSMRLVFRTEKRSTPTTVKLQRPADASKVWLISQPWDLAGLFLEDGETVIYRIEAVDTAGSIGRSDERRLRVASGQKRTSATLLAELEKIQKQIESASRLMATVRRDIGDVRQLFRPEDIDFQAAERLLLSDTINRVARETRAASAAIEKATYHADWAPLKTLLTGLSNALERFSSTELRPLQSSAARAHTNDPQAIAAGLDVLLAQTPAAEERLKFLHQALTLAHRYTGSVRLDERASDVKEAQQKITPILVGTAGWSPKGTYTPGLMGEYYRGQNFETLVRRTVDTRFELKNADVPDVGRENYSVRWKGQVLAPKAGRYVFRISADDGVRLSVAGKRLFDEWRGQAPTAFEGAAELTQGWHDIVIEYFQGTGTSEMVLTRSGPKMPNGAIPAEQLRNLGTPVIDTNAAGIKEMMAKGATESSVEQALVRQQTMITVARGIPPDLMRLANLKPEVDAEAQKDATLWQNEIAKHTVELGDLKSLNGSYAVPLTNWREQTRVLAHRCDQTRRRYGKLVEEWVKKLANDVFEASAKLKQLQQSAEAAKKAFDELTQAAKQPKDEKREAAMARADAQVHAMAEDLKAQADKLAEEFKAAAEDTARPLEERRMLQALQHRAEDMAQGPAEALEKRLAEAKTPEALAQTETKVPNFGTQAAQLAQKAAESAQAAEKMERAVALRDALAEAANEEIAARDLLNQPPTAETAAAQQRAAAELRENASEIQQALEAAKPALSQPAAAKAQQALEQAANNNRIAEMLEKNAAKALAGDAKTPKKNSDEDKARQNAAKELAADAKKAAEAAEAVNNDLAAAAQQLNGDAAQQLREAAQNAQQTADALKSEDAKRAVNDAAEKAEAAADAARQTAERLALDAEAARKNAANDAQRARADDMVRLAAAINNEVEKKLDPAAEYLERAQQTAAAEPAAAAAMPQAERQKHAEDAKAEAAKLNKLAEIAAQLNTQDPNQQKAAHDALSKVLTEQGASEQVEAALKQAEALDKLAASLQPAENTPAKPAQPNAPQDPAAAEAGQTPPSNEAIENAEKALAKMLGEDAQQASKAAMAERLNDLAQDLREQAEADRQLANRIGQAGNLEQQARENLKKEAPALAQALKKAQTDAAKAAKDSKSPEASQPLDNAQKALAQAASATEAAAQKADSAPLSELAKSLDKIAGEIEKPIGEIAAALPKAGEGQDEAQQAGQQARQAAGREAELAAELERAERAADMAQADAQAASGDRESLEAQVKAAIEALEKEGGLAAGNPELAALAKAANAGEQNEGAQADAQPGEQAGQEKQGGQKAAGEQSGQQGQPSGQKGSQPGQQASKGQGQKGQASKGGKGGKSEQAAEPSLKEAFQAARTEAERLNDMAAQIEKLAAAINPEGQASQPSALSPDIATPAADALEALAAADAAGDTGAQAEAAAQAQNAAELLSQAAEAARSQATGMDAQGGEEAQAMSEGKSLGQSQGKGQAQGKGKGQSKGQGQGQQAGKQVGSAKSKGALAPEPPSGLPIDKATWNRLPDSVRRDLLNAAGGRFPAEYEASIKRYFKNVASTKEEKAQ